MSSRQAGAVRGGPRREWSEEERPCQAGQQGQRGPGHRPTAPAEPRLGRLGPLRSSKVRAAELPVPRPRQNPDEARVSLQVSPRLCGQAGPRTSALMGSHGVLSRTEGQD